MSSPLPKPDLCLRVGIVGNRNFTRVDESKAEDLARFEESVIKASGEVFLCLDSAVARVGGYSQSRNRFSDKQPRIKVISALAKGGDQLGTLAAIRPQGVAERTCDFEYHPDKFCTLFLEARKCRI